MSRTVLVTGGAGFIGANLARLLVARGDRVRVLDDCSIGSLRYLDGLGVEVVVAPLADTAAVGAAIAGTDAVVHLAARAGIPDSVADPLGTFETNVAATVALLDATRQAGVPRFVFASSNAAAGAHPPPVAEDDLPAPTSPYGASKLAGEAYCQAYAATYDLVATSLRFANAYGPRSLHKKSVVAAWLRAALAGEPLTIHGDGRQTRDFLFVEDVARAILAVLDAPAAAVRGERFLVGTGVETTILDLAAAVERAIGTRLERRFLPERPGDLRRNVGRVTKIAERLGWRAIVDLESGLAATAAWFREALADPELAAIRPHAASGSE
jgi:UDP-glucose 4-epimerase